MPKDHPRDVRPSAVALEYTPDRDSAPRVTAQGHGVIAERIIAAAREAGVPIHHDTTLVQLLMQFDLDTCIPPALYDAVAEILAFLYKLDREWKQQHRIS